MKVLLSILSLGVVSAHGDAGKHKEQCGLPALGKACNSDYGKYCKQVDDLDLVSLLSCGKRNEASLQPTCLDQIKKSVPALYACSDDLHEYCPSFGRLAPGQWEGNDNDDDDDDDGGRRRSGMPPKPQPQPPAVSGPAAPASPVSVKPQHGSQPDRKPNPTPNRFANDPNAQCLKKNLPAFSASCHNAIAEQWLARQTKKGITAPTEPTPDEIFMMLSPPAASSSAKYYGTMKTQRVILVIIAVISFCCVVACLCCCCRRCKKRRAQRARVGTEMAGPEVALVPLPEAVAVPMSAPIAYVPLATPVPVHAVPLAVPHAVPHAIPHAVPAHVASPLPYNGKGLGTYMPVAQPAHV